MEEKNSRIYGGSIHKFVERGVTQTTEAQYRSWLDQQFRPMFASYEGRSGYPVEKLLHYFEHESHGVARHKLRVFISKIDKNRNHRVTYKEFYDAMIRKTRADLSRGQCFLLTSVLAASPAIKSIEKKKVWDEFDKDKLDDEIPDSYFEAYNCRPPPIFIPLSCLAQVIVFIIYAVKLNSNEGEKWNHHRSLLIFDPSKREQAWRFVSYMLIHADYYHIIFNVISQIIMGIPLELVHKAWRVGPVFLAGVVFGALASSIEDPQTMLVGSSGGGYALFGAHFALVIINWEELQYEWLNIRENPFAFMFSGVMRLIVLVLILAADLSVALYMRYQADINLRLSYSGHVGGFLAGLLVGIPVLKNLDKKPWEKYVTCISLAIFSALFLFGILLNVLFDGFSKEKSA